MAGRIDNVTQLRPIVVRAVKALYGRDMQNISILKAEPFPLFKEPKQGWMVHTEFSDDRFEYAAQLDVQRENGVITRMVELHRTAVTR